MCFGAQKNHLIETILLSTHNICFGEFFLLLVTSATVYSKVVVLLLQIHCLLLLPLFVGILCLVLVLSCSTYSPF